VCQLCHRVSHRLAGGCRDPRDEKGKGTRGKREVSEGFQGRGKRARVKRGVEQSLEGSSYLM